MDAPTRIALALASGGARGYAHIGAIRAERVVAVVRDLLDGARIEDLPIPYTAVATDVLAGKSGSVSPWSWTGTISGAA